MLRDRAPVQVDEQAPASSASLQRLLALRLRAAYSRAMPFSIRYTAPALTAVVALGVSAGCAKPESAPPSPLASAAPSASAPPAKAESVPPPDTFDVAAIDAYLASQVTAKGLVGLSVAILDGGSIVFAKGYGQRSKDRGQPVEVDTAFAIGSVTKQFTCAAAYQLAEQHKLSMSDKVAKHYPELTRAGDVTLDDVGAHLAGYRDYYPLDFLDRRFKQPTEVDAVIDTYAKQPLDFEPRARWSYSNTGFLVLGRVVEKVSGQRFADYARDHLFKPAKMTHTSFEPPPDAPGLATGHAGFALGAVEPAMREAPGWIHAAGAIYASASDLLRWDLALVDGAILKPEARTAMTTSRVLASGRSTSYGCGIGVGHVAGEPVLRHTGAVSGFLAFNTIVPRTRSAVVVLSNRDDVEVRPLHDVLLGLVLKERPSTVPKVSGPPAKDVAKALWAQLKSGTVDRSTLGADYAEYLTEPRITAAARRLSALGEPTIDLENVSERGGMEVSTFRLSFASKKARAVLFRSVDGKVQQFLLYDS